MFNYQCTGKAVNCYIGVVSIRCIGIDFSGYNGILHSGFVCLIYYPPLKKIFFMGDNNLGSVRPAVRPRFVCPDEYLQHQWIFFSDTLHMHLLQSSHESCEVSSGSTYRHFCLLKLTKYLKFLSVLMDISNTNEYFFSILYTCIYYHTLMNSVNFC